MLNTTQKVALTRPLLTRNIYYITQYEGDLAFHSLLRKMIILPILTLPHVHISL